MADAPKPLKFTGARVEQYQSLKAIRKLLDAGAYEALIGKLNKQELLARRKAAARADARARKEEADDKEYYKQQAAADAERDAKKGAKRVERNEKAKAKRAAAKPIVKKGVKYNLQWDVQYTVDKTFRNGRIHQSEVRQKTFPAGAIASTLPKEFGYGGVFTASSDMTRDELIDWMRMNVLLKQFSAVSEMTGMTTMNLTAEPVSGVALGDIPMRALKHVYKKLGTGNARAGHCVTDYILAECAKPGSRRQLMTRVDVEALNLHTANDIKSWARACGDISVYTLDNMGRVFGGKVIAVENVRMTLIFMVNDNHLFPVNDDSLRRSVVRTERLNLTDVDIKVDMENVLYYDAGGVCRGETLSTFVPRFCEFIASADKHVVLPVDKLDEVVIGVLNDTGVYPTQFQHYNGQITAFVHPTKDIVIMAGRDFEARKRVCDYYFAENKIMDFAWANQSWGVLGLSILEHKYHHLPKSHYSPDAMAMFKAYPVAPYRMCNSTDATGVTSIDIRRCYTGIVTNYNDAWNVGGNFDCVVPFTHYTDEVPSQLLERILPGEYFVSKMIVTGCDAVVLPPRFWDHASVKFFLREGLITGKDITHVMFADRHLPANTFQAWAEEMYALRGLVADLGDDMETASKSLVNNTIGCLGSLYMRTAKVGITHDFDTAMATIAGDEMATVHRVGDAFIVQQIAETMKTSGHYLIYRQIINASIIALIKMIKAVEPEEIVCINTDAIKVRGAFNRDAVKSKKDCAVGEFHIEEKEPVLMGRSVAQLTAEAEAAPLFTLERPEVVRVSETAADWDMVLKKGGNIVGMPGCGKTYQLKALEAILVSWYTSTPEEREKTLYVAYTHAAAQNLRKRGIPHVNTLKAALYDGNGGVTHESLKNYERVIIDEYGMAPGVEMGAIMHAKKAYGTIVIAFGDPDQCRAPVDNFVVYETNPLFLDMCNNYVVTMEYKHGGQSRYDVELYDALVAFKRTRVLDWECDEVESYTNIVARNHVGVNSKDNVNKRCFQRYVAEHNAAVVKFGFPVCLGLPVMAYHNTIKELSIYKTQIWTVQSIAEDAITLRYTDEFDDNTVSLDKKTFSKVFDYSFAFTPQKGQGITIHGHYNIYGAEQMSWDVLYTALSRGTKRAHVHVVTKSNEPYERTWRKVSVLTKLAPHEVHRGTIYEILLENGRRYIGQVSDRSADDRLCEHIASPTNKAMRKYLTPLATVRVLAEFNYIEKATINRVEEQYIKAAIERGVELANVQHNTAKKPAAVTDAPEPAPKKANIKIGENAAKQRYEVRLRRANVEKGDQVARFPWAAEGKAAAHEKAQTHVNYLAAKYF